MSQWTDLAVSSLQYDSPQTRPRKFSCIANPKHDRALYPLKVFLSHHISYAIISSPRTPKHEKRHGFSVVYRLFLKIFHLLVCFCDLFWTVSPQLTPEFESRTSLECHYKVSLI